MQAGDRRPQLSLRGRLADTDATRTDEEEDTMHEGSHPNSPPPRGAPPSRPSRGPVIRRIGSRELMGSSGQLIIRHAGDEYRLRVTSKGKLILTK
jgi:hemin uptake protein HemP